MQASRIALRAQRVARVHGPTIRRNVRFASDSAATPNTAAGSGAVTGGLAGAAAALAVAYGWYQFSGAKSAVQTAKQAKSYYDSATNTLKVKFQEKTPDTNEALQTIREAANKYASFIPGGQKYVDTVFQDIEAIRQKHGDEVDNIVREAYDDLRNASKQGLSLDTASDTYNILTRHGERLFHLAGDAAEDILNNHPQLKERLGGSADQLKQLGERLGPEAKQKVDQTWREINDIAKQGMQADTAVRVWTLVQRKTQELREMGEKAFQQGLEQARPLLEKNPQVKKVVEENMETLRQGDAGEIFRQVRQAVESGQTGELEKYVQQAKQKVQQHSSGQLSSWLDMIPQGSEILPQLQKMREVVQKQGKEAEDLAKETIAEIKQVLDRKKPKVEELYESGKQEAKKDQ